jgi:hypothetical protein
MGIDKDIEWLVNAYETHSVFREMPPLVKDIPE